MVSGEITKEMSKPSSPTPPHLRKLQLSFLDQLAPPTYTHIILYFQPSPDHHLDSDEMSLKLKRSLSDALAVYYPLAGRVRENSWVDCNDAGTEYVEAWFYDVRISDVVENPRTEELKQYVPAAPFGGGDIPLAVQVSFFGCSGTAIGICMWHGMADALSMVGFINTWAAACGGDVETVAATQPNFNLASRFPPVDFSRFSSWGESLPPQKIVTRRFTFDAQKIEALRKAAAGPLLEKPTKVEAVSAFIWRHFIEAVKMKDENRCFAAAHVVDIRSRASPPLPRHFFGNALGRSMAITTADDQECDYHDLAIKLREAIRKIDSKYVSKLEDGETFLKYYSANEENDPAFKDGKKSLETCCFTSWSRLPVYDADYGWGKPVWVSTVDMPLKNLVVLFGTKSGDGIEAWVNMVEEDIAMIESNYRLLSQIEETVR